MFPCRLCTNSQQSQIANCGGAGFAFRRPHLLHFSEHQICVFNVHTAEWVQTINLRLARPLHRSGLFILCQVLDLPHLLVLGSHQPGLNLK
jgi:hypothetical protein